MKKKIRVLVVDDSIVFREAIIRGLSTCQEIEVVGRAGDAYEARDRLLELEPDVMTCDVEMPKMNGIDFVRKLLPQYPIPVIMVSGITSAVFDALDAGAVDFVGKPSDKSPDQMQIFIKELIDKIKIASNSHVNTEIAQPALTTLDCQFVSGKIVAMGASTGGTEALYNVLKMLPPTMPPTVIVQHIPPVFSKLFAERLDKQTNLSVKEAEQGDYLEVGKVLIAPGDKHMRIKKIGDRYKVEVFEGEKVNGHCPSVDVLFDSVAKEAGKNALGVILTGMGYDGAKGLLSMRRKGAMTLGQDEKSSVVYGMPKTAYEIGGVEKQLALSDIPKAMIQQLKKS